MLSVNGMASADSTEAEAVADVNAVISEVDAVTTKVDAVISEPTEPANLLDCLKSPTRSELSRKRQVEKPKSTSSIKKTLLKT